MMKIAICDDDLMELENLRKVMDDFVKMQQPFRTILYELYNDPYDLLIQIEKKVEFDLLILDVIMPGMDGIKLATEVRNENTACKIIFLTSSSEFAVDSYKVDAFYYLLKPYSEDKLLTLLTKAANSIKQEKKQSIIIKDKNKITRVKTNTIQYLESIKHELYFHMLDKEVLSCYGTINSFQETLLSYDQFVRCHKSYIVNIDYVLSISERNFILEDKTMIPISRNSYKSIKQNYIDYILGKG